MGHFLKTDRRYEHASDFLLWKTMQAGHQSGFSVFNMQQDLGVPGLRKWKQSWNPTRFLKKYVIQNRQGA